MSFISRSFRFGSQSDSLLLGKRLIGEPRLELTGGEALALIGVTPAQGAADFTAAFHASSPGGYSPSFVPHFNLSEYPEAEVHSAETVETGEALTPAAAATIESPVVAATEAPAGETPAAIPPTIMTGETLSATQTVTFAPGGDVDGDGVVDPGDTLVFTVTIANNSIDPSKMDATGVQFIENLAGTPSGDLVGMTPTGMINISPIAFNDTYAAVGNTLLEVGNATGQTGPQSSVAGSVLTNDVEFFGDTFTISAFQATSANGGTVTMITSGADAGSFTYISAAGFEGADTFTYTIRDKGIDGVAGNADDLTSTATVTINVGNFTNAQGTVFTNGQVWYIDGSFAGTSTGTSTNPYKTLAEASGATGGDGTGDHIYINTGSYDGGITLLNNQILVGEGSALVVGGNTLAAAGTDATITNSTAGGHGVTLASGNTLTGLTIGNTNGYDIANTTTATVGNLTISNVELNGNGGLFRADGGGTLNVTFDTASTTGTGSGIHGIHLSGAVGGTLTLNAASMNNIQGTPVLISGGTASVDYNGTIFDTGDGRTIDIQNHTAGTISFDGNVNSQTAADGINLQNNGGATINFTGILTLNTSASNTTAFNATGGGTISASASGSTINSGSGTAINVVNTNIGLADLIFQSVNVNGAVNGIVLNNTGTSASFGGLTITGNSAGLGGGSVTVQPLGTANTFTAPVIADLTGGTIQNTTGDAIVLMNTRDVSLTRIYVNDALTRGIFGDNVTNFSLTSSFFDNNGDNVNTPEEHNLHFLNLFGIASITNSTITGSDGDEIRFTPSSGTLTNFIITGTVIGNDFNDGTEGGINSDNGNGLTLSPTGTSVMTVNITNSVFTNVFAANIVVNGQDTASRTFNVSFTSFLDPINDTGPIPPGGAPQQFGGVGISLQGSFSSDLTFNVSNNTFLGIDSNAINISLGSQATLAMDVLGVIDNNRIGNGMADSGSRDALGIAGESNGGADAVIMITNNIIQHTDQQGIFFQTRNPTGAVQGGRVDLTVRDNTVSNMDDNTAFPFFFQHGMWFDSRNTSTLVLDIAGNTSTGIGGAEHIMVRNRDTSFFYLERFDDGDGNFNETITNTTTVQNFVNGQNDPGTTTLAVLTGTFRGFNEAPDNFLRTAPTYNSPFRPDLTDESATAPESGSGRPTLIVDISTLDGGELALVTEMAIQLWANAGASAEQIAAMRGVSVGLGNLYGSMASYQIADQLVIDYNNAGRGWSSEDLLGLLLQELGAEAGIFGPVPEVRIVSAVPETLPTAAAEAPATGATPAAEAPPAVPPVIANGPVPANNIPTLPAGQQVVIQFTATVDPQTNQLIVNPVNTGTATATNPTGFPDANTNTVTTVIDTLTLGGTLWRDNGAGGGIAGDGIKQAGEVGIDGVSVSLFVDADNNNIPDTPGTALATTTSAGGGNYSFTGLAPGNYIVRANTLAGHASTLGNPDPDDNIDNDDNGFDAGGFVFANVITLAYNTEPDGNPGGPGDTDGDADDDTNFTVDLGYFDLNAAPTQTNLAGDTATYTEQQAQAAFLDVGSNAVISDVDSANFDTGTLTVSITNIIAAEDRLVIRVTGTVSFTGTGVFVSGPQIATYTGGGASPYVFTFNANATPANVSELVRALAYNNVGGDNPTAGTRNISWSFVDGDGTAFGGADTLNVSSSVNVVAVNDAPAGTDATFAFNEDGSRTLAAADFGFSDPAEGNAFAGVVITTLPTNGVLLLNGTPITVAGTFVTAAQITANQLVFQSDANENGTPYATFTFQVRDNGGVLNGGVDTDQSANTLTFNVTAVNDAPTSTNLAGDVATWTEAAASVLLDVGSNMTLADVDSANFDGGSLTITITAGLVAAQDQLLITATGGVTFDATTVSVGGTQIATYTGGGAGGGALVFSFDADATPAAVQALMRAIGYINGGGDAPTAGSRTIDWNLIDGDGTTSGGTDTLNVTTTVNVVATNDNPVIADLGGDNATFTEEGPAVLLDTGVAATVSDVDNAHFNGGGLLVSIIANEAAGEDVLGISTAGGVTLSNGTNVGSVVSVGGIAIGTVTANGTGGNDLVIAFNTNDATPARVSTLLQSLTYANTNTVNPSTAARSISVLVDDGAGGGDGELVFVNVVDTPENASPVLDLNGAGGGIDNAAAYTENAAPTVLAPTDLTVTDVDDTNIESALVQITGGFIANFDYLTINGATGPDTLLGIAFSYSAATGILTLTGSATLADYQAVLRQVGFESTSNDPGPSRTISWTVNDGTSSSAAAVTTVTVTEVNDEPQLTGTGASATLTEGGAAIDLFSVVDASTIEAGQSLTSLTLTVTNVTDGVNEILNFDGSNVALTNGNAVTTATNGLTVTVTVAGSTATVTFSGATLSSGQLVTLVDGLSYNNTSQNPTDANRVITITELVDSGSNASPNDNTATLSIAATVNVDPANDAPLNTVPGTQTINEDASVTLSTGNGNAIQVADADATALTVTLTVTKGTLTLASTAGLSFGAGDGTADLTMTFSGTAAAINAALGAGLTYNPNANFNGSDSIAVFTTDNGQSGGPTQTDSDSITINITAINDAPVVAGDGTEDAATIDEDTPGPGQTIQALFAGQYSDAADNQIPNGGASSPGQFSGIAVIANGSSAATGQWQYFSGGVWTDIGTVSSAAAKLFGDPFVTLIRFNPALDFSGPAPTLTVHLIDNSLPFGIVNGQVVDLSGMGATGGTTAYSAGTVVLSQFVTPDNLPPVVDLDGATAGVNYTTAFAEDGAAVAIGSGVAVSDPDAVPLGDMIESATITLTDRVAGDSLTLTGALPPGIIAVTTPTAGAITIQITGTGTGAQYQALIESILYSTTSQDPTVGGTDLARTVTVTVNDGEVDSATATTTINITASDDAPVAQPDAFIIDEATVLIAGNLFADNGSGPDSDPDGPPLAIAAVNGSAGNVGMQITLASGALLTVYANGTFDYDTNNAFDPTPTPGSGASNQPAQDSFNYTLAGGNTVTVTLTINGLDTDDLLIGTAGSDMLFAGNGADTLVGLGGNDFMDGGAGIDTATFAGALTSFTDSTIGWVVTSAEGNDVLQNIEIAVEGSGQRNLLVGATGFATIQAAFDNAENGDTVRLATGTYTGTFTYDDTGLTVIAQPNAQINATFTPTGTQGITIAGANLNDTINTGAGDDRILFNVTTGGSDTVNTDGGTDVVILSGNAGQIRLTFRSSEVGNGDPNDSVAGGLNVRLQAEDGADGLTGPQSRIDDEGIVFVAGAGQTFDVRDVSGAQRGDQFQVAVLGTLGADTLNALQPSRSYYFNAGMGNDVVIGGTVNDFLVGGAGDDFLAGGAGLDTYIGGGGNDTYFIEDTGEVLTEAVGGGTDVIYTTVNYFLAGGQEVEVLSASSLGGTSPLVLVGNEFAQQVYGNAGNNYLDGGGGADLLVGLGGEDIYLVDNAADYVAEAAGEGARDVVYALVDYTLNELQQVEVLAAASQAGTGALNLTGNELGQEIYGNAGANVLDGKGGNDVLVGFGGADSFAFSTALGAGNVDSIDGFLSGTDKLALDDAIFAGIGPAGAFNANAFRVGAAAGDADDRIIYNQATGQLFYDADGNGGGAQVLFATLVGAPTLTASDFTVI